MSNLSPFEIRLELLKMAKDILEQDYLSLREKISSDWAVKVENSRHAGITPPDHPGFPSYPTENDIIIKAQTLNGFVSNITVDKPTSKKST
jgi:hypothetical protein